VPKRRRSYVLTKTAARDFREARQWSKTRWGDQTTKSYFQKLHDGAEYIAAHQAAIASRDELTGNAGLGVYPIGEHFLVYVPIDRTQVAIVALIRQVRDVPAILQANHFQIQRALNEALEEFSKAIERDRLKS
jgi:plasmid stabilization system protein ParE